MIALAGVGKKDSDKFGTLQEQNIIGSEFLSGAEHLEEVFCLLPYCFLLFCDLCLLGLLAKS